MDRSIYVKTPEIANVTLNVKKKIVFDICVDNFVSGPELTAAASLIMDVMQNRIAPNIPVPIEYGLPINIFADLSNGNLDFSYDYGIIIYCIVQSIDVEIENMSPKTMTVEGKTLNVRKGSKLFIKTLNNAHYFIKMKFYKIIASKLPWIKVKTHIIF